ncbi:MAG: class I SAM-dependent methyltransferase [Cyanobacteria bacterium P01_A01_bin.105]
MVSNLYSRFVLPRLMDWAMSGTELATYRAALLKDVTGDVLEVGFGTGLNLPYYALAAAQLTSLTVIDANEGMGAIAAPRVEASPIPVNLAILNGEALPMADASFDCVVSTWTLCSIAKVEQALAEIHRVLRPGGRFFFIEHGRSPDPGLAKWQDRLTPLQKRIADGCHLNRPIRDLVAQIFEQASVETFYAASLPQVGGYFYQGTAIKGQS